MSNLCICGSDRSGKTTLAIAKGAKPITTEEMAQRVISILNKKRKVINV